VDVKSAAGTTRVFVDLVLIGRRGTEITLTTTAPMAAEAAVRAAELRLARILAARVAA
jgi:hypothetical protein